MSAWYVLSAMGFYSVTPGLPYYAIGSPTFEEAKINLENGKIFTVQAKNLSKKNVFIQSATLNGEPYNVTYLEHETILQGGEMVFTMGQNPSKWGTDFTALPPMPESQNNLVPTPFFSTSKNTFKDTLQIRVASLCNDCEIYMSTPSKNPLVVSDFMLNNKTVIGDDQLIGAFAKTKDGRYSDTIWTTFFKINEKLNLTLYSEYANQYAAGGDNALIDRQYGTANFRTGNWQGYQGQDFKATLDLIKPQTDAQISIGFLQDIKSWIWYPKKVIVDVYESDDQISRYEFYPGKGLEKTEGAIRTTVAFTHKGHIEKMVIIAESIGPCPEWHLGAGGQSWLFLDEITVD